MMSGKEKIDKTFLKEMDTEGLIAAAMNYIISAKLRLPHSEPKTELAIKDLEWAFVILEEALK